MQQSPSVLEAMSPEKRGLYNQLLQLKIDIHYDDARLDEWLKQKKYIIRKAAHLRDQLGHLNNVVPLIRPLNSVL